MPDSTLVWDESSDPPPGSADVLCWRSYAQGAGVASVPRYMEEHAEAIRGRYLAFIHALGERRIRGKRLVDHLDPGDGFSLWWMTHLAEKSPLKSPRIYDCLRLLALEEMLLHKRPSSVTLVSPDKPLARAVSRLCANLGIAFQWRRAGMPAKSLLRRVYDRIPALLQGALSLRHVRMRWPLRRLQMPQWHGGERAIFICSYFIHLDAEACAQGRFHSRQWEDLPEWLRNEGMQINWLQLFLFSAVVPDVTTGLNWLARFNRSDRQGCHAFLDSFLTPGSLARALRLWLWLNAVSWSLWGLRAAWSPEGSAVWFWPLLRDDWKSSVQGPVALASCLFRVLFEAALAAIPRQNVGLYLCENQPWEKAFIRAWRKHGHGALIGVQHSTAPFWHLYYFDDPRTATASGRGAVPQPDRLAVNGRAAWEEFARAGYPTSRLVEAEALRYMSLARVDSTREARPDTLARRAAGAAANAPLEVLILGDILPSSVHHLLRLVEAALQEVRLGLRFTFKPHPGYRVNLRNYPGINAQETQEALGTILGNYDVAVAANTTTAAVEAYIVGLPVIVGLGGSELNLSPLRGQPGVRFVGTGAELAGALHDVTAQPDPSLRRSAFFFLDPQLTRWRELLQQAGRLEGPRPPGQMDTVSCERRVFLTRLRHEPLFLLRHLPALTFAVCRRLRTRLTMVSSRKHRGRKRRPVWLPADRSLAAPRANGTLTAACFPLYPYPPPSSSTRCSPVARSQAAPVGSAVDPEDYFAAHRWGFLPRALLEGDADWRGNLDECLRWIESNTDKDAAAWEPYSACERLANLLVFAAAAPAHVRDELASGTLIAFVDDSLRWIFQHLEYYGPTEVFNHILNNARALTMAGVASANDAATFAGMQIFRNSLPALIMPAGFLRERSSHYQFVVLNWLLDAWHFVAFRQGADSDDARFLRGYVDQMVDAASWLLDCHGRLSALVGDVSPDATPSQSLSRLALLYPQIWTGSRRESPAAAVRDGWFRMAQERDMVLGNFGAGSHPPGFPTHGHSDHTAFVWLHDSIEVLSDGGRARYTADPVSLFQKSATGHSVPLVNGMAPVCEPLLRNGQWWPVPYAIARLEACESERGVTLSHDGFARATPVSRHVRRITPQQGSLRVSDSFEGRGCVDIALCWHFGPGFSTFDAQRLQACGSAGQVELLCEGVPGPARVETLWSEPPGSWTTRCYGSAQPSLGICLRWRIDLPATLHTHFRLVVGPGS